MLHTDLMSHLFNTDKTKLVSTLFHEDVIERVCNVLLGHGVFFIVEPSTDEQVRVFVKDEATSILKDLKTLAEQKYPFTLYVDLDQEKYEYADKVLPWHAQDADGIEVEPLNIIMTLAPQHPLSHLGAYFLDLASNARGRGVEYLRFHED